jgi:hypothetical protein
MLKGGSEWIRGRLEDVQEEEISLDTGAELKRIKKIDIRKTKLDS